MRDYHNLDVWKRAHNLVVSVYRHTTAYPPQEHFALTGQTRRAAVSIPANIAEGAGKATRPDYANFLSIASGSLNELECLLEIGQDLGFGEASQTAALIAEIKEVRAMVTALRPKVNPGGR
jgi:four helix bundle protein